TRPRRCCCAGDVVSGFRMARRREISGLPRSRLWDDPRRAAAGPGADELRDEAQHDQRHCQNEHALACGHGLAVDAARLADGLLVLHALQALVRIALAWIARDHTAHGAHALELLLHLELAAFVEE